MSVWSFLYGQKDKPKHRGRHKWSYEDRERAREAVELKQDLKRKEIELRGKKLELAERRLQVESAKLKAEENKYLSEAADYEIDDNEDDDDEDDDDEDDFNKLAKSAMKEVIKRGQQPIVTGTGDNSGT